MIDAEKMLADLYRKRDEDTRKHRLSEMIFQWLRMELNARFALRLSSGCAFRHLEEMSATLVSSAELFDKDIQNQLLTMEKTQTEALYRAMPPPVVSRARSNASMPAADIIALYDRLAAINDGVEQGDDGYARFASTNDADRLREVVSELESKYATLLFPSGDSRDA